ncbi:hypothetical protein BJX70DRAFT_390763 [Aspergillus crustosus]
MDDETFNYIFHHIVLPPKLPGASERSQGVLEKRLMVLVRDTLSSFLEKRSQDNRRKWKPITNMIDTWLHIESGYDLNRHQEALAAHVLLMNTTSEAVALYICAQNCGWLAYYDHERDEIIIDAFEASCASQAVLKAQGPLIRCFPGQSVAISATMSEDTEFCKYLAHELCRLNLEVVRMMCPKGPETRAFIEETRDTIDPNLITEGLMTQLLAFGENKSWNSFEKHVRDEVNYDGGCRLPWRRSPLWFVIKVALQTILYRAFPDSEGRTEYKNFMLYMTVEIGSIAASLKRSDIVDVLAVMQPKAARRVYKLQDKAFGFVLQRVTEVNQGILDRLRQIQGDIRDADLKTIPDIFGPVQDSDTTTSLINCGSHLREAMLDMPATSPLPKDEELLSLIDFENWVDTQLQSWLATAPKTDKACCDVAELIGKYSRHADRMYGQDPVALSLMMLTILELWVAMDKLCISVCELLRHFSPEIPKRFLEPLLLPHRSQMKRAEEVEKYIGFRRESCAGTCDIEDCEPKESIFADPGPRTFAARYFHQTRCHTSLLDRIIASATQNRDKRHNEWEMLLKDYDDLLSEASNLSHNTAFDESGVKAHLDPCQKCELERIAKGLEIEVYEWPLPREESFIKNVVFEPDCPRWFAQWRDITWKIVDGYGRPQKREPSRTEMELLQYLALKEFASNSTPPRLTIVSIPTGTQMWVAARCKLAIPSITIPSIKHMCTLTVDDVAYSSLQGYIISSRRSQNKITLQEMCAFGHLRCGERLQWYTMTRELASHSISMSKEPVHTLFCQAAWELGSPVSSTPLREAHAFFEEPSSTNKLLEMLELKLYSIESNWNEHHTLHTLIILGLRTLSLGLAPVFERSARFLRRCRQVAMQWCTGLTDGLGTSAGEVSSAQLALLFRIGGICLWTFSLEEKHLPRLLQTAEDLKVLPIENQSIQTRAIVLQATRVLCRAERRVSEMIRDYPSPFNGALQETARNLHITSPWSFGDGDSSRWAINKSTSRSRRRPQAICYNILAGELFVDHQRPSRLPENYTNHPLFQRILDRGFSRVLVMGHAHWLDLRTGLLEFRPLDKAWQPEPGNWRMFYRYNPGEYTSTKQGQRQLISDVLQCLDRRRHIRVTTTDDGTIEVKLTRLHLDFVVNAEGALECPEHDAIVGQDQDIGCLYGLSNKLVLRDKVGRSRRLVLIPYGSVWMEIGASHTNVMIELPSGPGCRCFHYLIDSSALYLAYLHAITTFVLPDPVTRRSGTEEALRILGQACMKSPFPLDSDCTRLLELIASLTPQHHYVPVGLEAMQSHDNFRRVAQGIFDHVARLVQFYSGRKGPPMGTRFRHSRFYRSEFGGIPSGEDAQPEDYKAGDRIDPANNRIRRVYQTAKLIRDWPTTLGSKEDLLTSMSYWGNIDIQIRPPNKHTYTSLLESSMRRLWTSLYDQCRLSRRERDTFSLISVFCTVAFGGSEVSQLRPLLAVAFSESFPEIPRLLLMESLQLELEKGQTIDKADIAAAIDGNYPPFKSSSKSRPTNLSRVAKTKLTRAEHKDYDKRKDEDVDALADYFAAQLPCETLKRPPNAQPWQIKSVNDCTRLIKRRNREIQFFQFIEAIQTNLYVMAIEPMQIPLPPGLPPRLLINPRSAPCHLPELQDLLLSSTAPSPMEIDFTPVSAQRPQTSACVDPESNDNLQSLISGLPISESLEALNKVELFCTPKDFPLPREDLLRSYERLSHQSGELWKDITSALTAATELSWEAISGCTLWPSITVLSMLSFLTADKWDSVPEPWKNTLLMFAKTVASLRRYERLIDYFEKGDVNSFYKEAEAVGYKGWVPSEIPDWLLLEIESNLTIRERQAEVAQKMIVPDDLENAVLQLNMGEGKTTVITPMTAAHLADGSQLVRIIVLKPLLRQSVHLLSQRVGGLLNRPIYYVPFSRATRLEEKTIETLWEIYHECQAERGILITLPEQLLSFRLVGLDSRSDKASRTIIDENDEILDPKFQLVYTRGNQQNKLSQDSLQIEEDRIRYPLLRFMTPDAPGLPLQKTIDAIKDGKLPGVSFSQWALRTRESALRFIRDLNINPDDEKDVREVFRESVILKKLLVLRGLFAHGILQFALASKRWLVEYGIHPSRSLLAVPFKAKGVPSDNSEFGQPDVALILTCLSYYYQGLTKDQVRQCFHLLLKYDDQRSEYQRWIEQGREKLPESLHTFTGVNLEDKQSFEEQIYPHIRYQKGIINFFLSRVVFPREAKEFPYKLSTTAWDIPSKPGQPLTTGFSGTNDNCYLLPMSMPQKDLPHLQHTNAMVLYQLLRMENRQCVLAEDQDGHHLSVSELLRLVSSQKPCIQVMIDVGAQILESGNQEVARMWLSEVESDRADAAIYFNEEDEVMVVDRDNYFERLLSSPYRGRIDRCLVFLDQHHSRGIDLKLPQTYRAAVTLGPRLTKDRLVQACGRMRELDSGQSVAFFIPPEVKHGLKKSSETINSYEVIEWALNQTYDHLERLQPLWAWQGLQHLHGEEIWDDFRTNAINLEEVTARIQEPESKSLAQLYSNWEDSPDTLRTFERLASVDDMARELLRTWKDRSSPATVALNEEQEREIAQEIHREQQVSRPPSVEPRKHQVHSDLRHYVKHGHFPLDFHSGAVKSAFECVSRTTAAQFNIPADICVKLYASIDFLETVNESKVLVDDEFSNHYQLIMISQHEANELLPNMRKSTKTALHIYSPRITTDTPSFGRLDFLSIGKSRHAQQNREISSPEILRALEIFSGSLYFDSFREYKSACHFFGIKADSSIEVPDDRITSDGFVDEQTRVQVSWPVTSPFKTSPLPFLKSWYSIRMKGQGFSQSHVGAIVEATAMTEDQF